MYDAQAGLKARKYSCYGCKN